MRRRMARLSEKQLLSIIINPDDKAPQQFMTDEAIGSLKSNGAVDLL